MATSHMPSCPKLMRSTTRDAQTERCIISRLGIGHRRLTHSFRMENRPLTPNCNQCIGNHELTVKHILIECDFLKMRFFLSLVVILCASRGSC